MKRIGRFALSSMGLLFVMGLLLALRVSGRGACAGVIASSPGTSTSTQTRYVVAEVTLADVGHGVLSIASGDLDRDGALDLVSDGLLAWANPYTDSFASPWLSATLAADFRAQDVALGDLDRDGDLDMVAGGSFGLIIWQNPLTQSASTPFGTWPVSQVLTTSQPVWAVAVADLDNDTWPDIAAARDDPMPPVSGDLSVWRNPRSFTGTWTSTVLTTGQGIHTVATGDLDKDGWADLVTGSAGQYAYAQEVRVWQNDHTPFAGTWASYQVVDVFQDGISSDVNSVVPADLDGDGWPDIVAGYQTGTAGSVGVWRNLGTPFTMPWTLSVTMMGGARVWRVAAGDLDHNGSVDVVSAAAFSSTGNEVTWWWNDGSPFDGAWPSTWRVGPWRSDLLLADLNGNGDLETVVAQWDSPEIAAYVALWEHTYLPVATSVASLWK